MIVCKRRRNDSEPPLSTIVATLGSVYRPDPVIPDAMLALLRTLDVPAVYVVAATSVQKPLAL